MIPFYESVLVAIRYLYCEITKRRNIILKLTLHPKDKFVILPTDI